MLRRTFMQFFASLLALFGLGIEAAEAKTHLSTKIHVIVDEKIIGTINTLNVEETRNLVTRQPQYCIKADRIRFDKMRVEEAFSRGVCNVKSQRTPFQIEIHNEFKPGGKVTTYIENAWVERIGDLSAGHYDKGIDIGDSILVYDVKMQCEDIRSVSG